MALKPGGALVLGMLGLGASSGYAIKKGVDRSTRFFWPTSLAHVYPELARLEKQGLVRRRDNPHGARPRSAYEVTRAGHAALLAWLRSSQEAPVGFRHEGILRLFFADALPTAEQITLVRRLRDRMRGGERELREDILPIAQTLEHQGLRFPAETARLGAELYRSAGAWLEQLEHRLSEESARPRE